VDKERKRRNVWQKKRAVRYNPTPAPATLSLLCLLLPRNGRLHRRRLGLRPSPLCLPRRGRRHRQCPRRSTLPRSLYIYDICVSDACWLVFRERSLFDWDWFRCVPFDGFIFFFRVMYLFEECKL
jgi:hypothetical protein